MTTIFEIERVLQTYTLEEIFDINETTQEDALLFLVDEEFIVLPNPRPVDAYE